MTEPTIIVLRDSGTDENAKAITVYVDGKKVEAKVLGWWSDDEWPSTFAPNVFVTCWDDDGCSDDYHVVLPDQWSEEEWAALVAAEGWMVP